MMCRDSDSYGRIGDLETRLARSPAEIDAAQAVRFDVFAREMGAAMPPEAMRLGRDIDAFDAVCDHLLVLDRSIAGGPSDQIVGTYRLLRQEVARANDGFYSTSEFAIDDMLARHPQKRFMELGRSCVLPKYRTRRTVELLWQGNWAYAREYGIDAMFGCASIPGVMPEAHALSLSFLYHNCLATGEWAVSARPELYQMMDLMPREAINVKGAVSGLPPLIKGYLRLGALVGDGAVVDRAFGTTDVMIVLPTERISDRYINYYGASSRQPAA
ncbi:MAG: GNAT family N-acetyltransferase [Alphaproteobacteria bacterium]|nr:GNAT family N-acetyltransferase [Alphaproteobacteria bacterium]